MVVLAAHGAQTGLKFLSSLNISANIVQLTFKMKLREPMCVAKAMSREFLDCLMVRIWHFLHCGPGSTLVWDQKAHT